MGVHIVVVVIGLIPAADAEKGNDLRQALQIIVLLGTDEAAVVVDAEDMADAERGAAGQGGDDVQGFQMFRLGNDVQRPLGIRQSLQAKAVDSGGHLEAAGKGTGVPVLFRLGCRRPRFRSGGKAGKTGERF